MKKELKFEDINVVFDNPKKIIDGKREFLIRSLQLYASMLDREIKVVFFIGEENEQGITCFYKRKEDNDK